MLVHECVAGQIGDPRAFPGEYLCDGATDSAPAAYGADQVGNASARTGGFSAAFTGAAAIAATGAVLAAVTLRSPSRRADAPDATAAMSTV